MSHAGWGPNGPDEHRTDKHNPTSGGSGPEPPDEWNATPPPGGRQGAPDTRPAASDGSGWNPYPQGAPNDPETGGSGPVTGRWQPQSPGPSQYGGPGQQSPYGQSGLHGQPGSYGQSAPSGQPGYGTAPYQAYGSQTPSDHPTQPSAAGPAASGYPVGPGAAPGTDPQAGPAGYGASGAGGYGASYGGYGGASSGAYGTPAQGWGTPAGMYPTAVQPGVIPLRPLSVGEVFDGAFQAIRRNPKGTIGSAAIVAGVASLVAFLIMAPVSAWAASQAVTYTPNPYGDPQIDANPAATVAQVVGSLLTGLVTMVLLSALMGMLSTAMGQAVMGRSSSPRQLFQAARPVMWRLVGLMLLLYVALTVILAVPLLIGAILFVAGEAAGALGLVLGGLVDLGLALYLGARLSLSTNVLVLEQASVTNSIRRSWNLTRRHVWRILGILLLTTIVSWVVSMVVLVPATLLAAAVGVVSAIGSPTATGASATSSVLTLLVYTLVMFLVECVIYPFVFGVITLLYLDVRMRDENLDRLLVEQAQAGPAVA